MDVHGKMGPRPAMDGGEEMLRLERFGGLVTQDAHGRYREAVSRGNVFYACNQGAQAVSVALATTYTGLMISNPLDSEVTLSLLLVNYALSVAPAAIAPLFLIGDRSKNTDVVHTAALTVQSAKVGQPGKSGAKADSQATIPTPKYILPLMGGFTAAALPSTGPAAPDIGGLFEVQPGGFVGIGALTAVTGFGFIAWEEIPIL